MNNKSNILN